MSASVDVLEVLDRANGQARMVAGLAGDPKARELLQDLASARDAVADLLDAARRCADGTGDLADLRTALARAGGAA
ncbi:hypothetical protein [Xanthomonas sp. 4461]|uniref:hypothetical protein n=1 Tax=Xanthomonas sp. 4461 TaxID=3035313 RepID=UPI0021686F12|nr:hypothetical protein [Xanthomonas sp. 4461]MCS3807844.1 hypothetical protein [Xanthomonas sp. 4461]